MYLDENFIRSKLDELRVNQKISERKMSLDLGHTASYMNNISTGRSLPSLTEFLYICEYLKITPSQFFESEKNLSLNQRNLVSKIEQLEENDVELMLQILERIKK